MSKPDLHCWWDGDLVATFRPNRNGAQLTCRYSPWALANVAVSTPLLSCSLPVQSKARQATNFCVGLLPEGRHRDDMARSANVASYDVHGLLSRYGRDVAGALVITAGDDPPGARPGSVEPYSQAVLEEEVASLDDNALGLHDDSELSIAGVQNKMLLVQVGDGHWGRPVHGYPSTHILKTDDPRYPGLIAAEAACLALAHRVGLSPAGPCLVRLAERDCLIITRFDRERDDQGDVGRMHQEDACQALDVDLSTARGRGKYEINGGPSLAQVAELLRRHSPQGKQEQLELVRQITFNTIIGNADWHGKNLSLLHDREGHVRLAPVYDTVPTMLWPNLRDTAATSVDGATDMGAITVERIAAEVHRWGLDTATARAAAVELAESVEAVASGREDELHQRITDRARRICGADPRRGVAGRRSP